MFRDGVRDGVRTSFFAGRLDGGLDPLEARARASYILQGKERKPSRFGSASSPALPVSLKPVISDDNHSNASTNRGPGRLKCCHETIHEMPVRIEGYVRLGLGLGIELGLGLELELGLGLEG